MRTDAGDMGQWTGRMTTRHHRLRDWKEIAAFFGRDERTVRRWERQRGLPVHRISGGARNLVFAYTDELERWLRSGSERSTEAAEPAASVVERGAVEPSVAETALPADVAAPAPAAPNRRPRAVFAAFIAACSSSSASRRPI